VNPLTCQAAVHAASEDEAANTSQYHDACRANQPHLGAVISHSDRQAAAPDRRLAIVVRIMVACGVRSTRWLTAGRPPPGRYGSARRSPPLASQSLPGGTGEVGGDDVGRVPVQAAARTRSYLMVVLGSACEAASCTSRSGTPAPGAAVMNACRGVCGPAGLVIRARRAARRTIRAAPCRSSRRPSPAGKAGPSLRSPAARPIARAVRGASGMVAALPPLRVMTSVRWPRSTPVASMLAPVASQARSPLSASSEMSACPAGRPSPAATGSAPSWLRSGTVACGS
jgi:hypothetical protein